MTHSESLRVVRLSYLSLFNHRWLARATGPGNLVVRTLIDLILDFLVVAIPFVLESTVRCDTTASELVFWYRILFSCMVLANSNQDLF